MSSFHLRITTLSRTHAVEIIRLFLIKFVDKLQKYIFSHEISEQGQSHVHAHLEYKPDKAPCRSTLCDFFKAQNLQSKYYNKCIQKTEEANVLYIIKELDIIDHNFPGPEFEQLMELTNTINKNKKLSPKEKLIQAFQDKIYLNLNDLASDINNLYIDQYDQIPPIHNTRKYALYVARKLNFCPSQYDDINSTFF